MRKKILGALALMAVATSLSSTSAAWAQDWNQNSDGRHEGRPGDERGPHGDNGDNRWQGNRDGGWDPADHYSDGNRNREGNRRDRGDRYRERRLGRGDDVFRGRDGRYYCRRNDGSTGLVIGALSGGVLGNVLGDGGTLGTLLGAGGGALLGRSIDRGNIRCR